MKFSLVLALCLAALTATPVAAQQPAHLPMRDVAVSYRITGTAARDVQAVHLRYTARANQLRVETNDRGMGFLLIDPRARTTRMVVPGSGHYVDLPLARDRRATFLFGDGLAFTRRGTARIAGLPCTRWDMRAGPEAARACITADGVVLRAEGIAGALAGSAMEATQVSYATQDTRLFTLPAGAMALNLRDLLPGLGAAR